MTDEEFIQLQKKKKGKIYSKSRKAVVKRKKKEEKKLEKEIKKQAVVPAIIIKEPSYEEVEASLKKNTGLLSYTAKDLEIPLEVLKKIIKKNKNLRNLLFDLRETITDIAEETLLYRMMEKKDGIIAMFVAKCLGKNRGWVEKPDKAGSSAQKPVFIRILPVDGNGGGKGKKLKAEIKVGAALPAAVTKEEKAVEEIMEAEVLDG